MGYQGITTPLDASANNPNAQLQVNGLGTTLQNNSIPVDSLAQSPTTPPTLPPAPAINPNYSLQTSTGNSLIQNNSGALNPPALTTDVSGNGTSPDLYASLMKSIQPDSGASTYNADETNSNISGLQTNANSANQSVIDATNKLNTLNAQLTGINNDTTSKNLSLQNEGGAITTGGVTNASNQNIRDAAIQALPLQVQIMGAQANVATAQGNASLAQNILQQAQDHVDKIFSIQQTDAQNEYSYNKSIVDTYYQYATTEQQAKLDDLKTQQAQDFQTQTNNLNEAQTLANTAITNGSADIAGKILALDPKSSTFTVDLGKLSAQIQQKPVAQTVAQTNQIAISNINSQLTKAVGEDGYTDPNLYAKLRSTSTLSGSDFDNRFAYLVNPESRAKLGLTSAQAGNNPIPGNFTPTQKQSLIGSGIPATQLDTIATYVAQYGLDAAISNSDMTDSQKTALKAAYGQ